jgi:hypothetical protein
MPPVTCLLNKKTSKFLLYCDVLKTQPHYIKHPCLPISLLNSAIFTPLEALSGGLLMFFEFPKQRNNV